MSWKEPNSSEEGPPDLQELISKIKNKLKSSFQAKNKKNSDVNEEIIPSFTCSCDNKNREYTVDVKVKCSACDKVVKQKTIKKPLKVAAILVIISYGGSQFIDYAISDNRYPLNVEYSILDTCINSYGNSISYKAFDSKKKTCLCALEDTMNEISYTRFNINENGFTTAFKENVKECT